MLKKLKDCVVTNKNVFLRADMNVPLKDGVITDDTRIRATIPTLKYLVESGAKVILATHIGNPKGRDETKSTKLLVARVSELLGKEVRYIDDCIGEKVRKAVEETPYGEVIMLENLRYHAGEKAGDEEYAKQLAELANLYVSDAFSVSHRDHASVTKLPKILNGCAGFGLEREIENLTKYVAEPVRPMMTIVGGAKVSTKLKLIKALTKKSDYVVIGGGMANTFLYAEGKNVGKSLCEPELKDDALAVMKMAKENNCELILPKDVVVAKEFKVGAEHSVVYNNEVSDDEMILDIGEESVKYIVSKLEECETVVWNGPIGVFEMKPFDAGTNAVAKAIANMTNAGDLISVAGGGDVVAALNASNMTDKFTYISTAGGAFLKWLEGKGLVGVDAVSE